MKCPYRTRIIHQSEYTECYKTYPAKDITEFNECYETECPFYYKTEYIPENEITEHCRRAESED